jgi:hypothetical protein
MNDSERETALQAHIREKLLDYALTHLTKNYITYTENAVTEVRLSTPYSQPESSLHWSFSSQVTVELSFPDPYR